MTIPTTLIAGGIFLVAAVSEVALKIAGQDVPAEIKYALVGSLTAALGGSVPSVNIGSAAKTE